MDGGNSLMALTLSEIKSRVRDHVDISSTNQLSETHLAQCINSEVDSLVDQLQFDGYKYLQNDQYVVLSTSTNYKDLDRGGIKLGLPTDFDRIISVKYHSTEYSAAELVKVVTPQEYDKVESQGDGSPSYNYGTRFAACVMGDANTGKRYLYISPDPEGIGRFRIRYYWRPAQMSDSGDETGLPRQFDNVIILGSAMRVLIKANDHERYQMLADQLNREARRVLSNASKSS